jgi:dipeptidyl aminopeptidase/acylaminoacyl peptidase
MKRGRQVRAPLPRNFEDQNSEFRIEKTGSDSANRRSFSSFSIRNSNLRNSVAYLVFFLLLITAPLGAFSIEDILSAPSPYELIAAKGRLAWAMNERGARNVWTAEGPKFEPRQLTKFQGDDGVDLGELTFSADGQWIAFTRGGDLETNGESPNPASAAQTPPQEVWTISLRDGSVRKIGEGSEPRISGSRVAFVAKKQLMLAPLDGSAKPEALIAATGLRNTLRWSPDGTKIAFVAQRKEHGFVGVVDVERKTVRYLDPSVDRDVGPVWSPDSKQVAFIRIPARAEILAFAPQRGGRPWSIRVADAATGKGRELWRADEGKGSVFRGTDSDDALFWLAGHRVVFPWEKDGWTHLYSIAVSGGAPKLLTPGEFEVENVGSDGRTIVYTSNEGDIDRRHVWKSDGASKPVALTTGKSIKWDPVIVDGSVACFRSDATHPGRPMVVGKGDLIEPAVPKDLVEPQPVIFAASDGLPIHGQLFLPRSGAAKHPAIVFFHGGSRRQMLLGWHYMGYYANAYAMNQYLASRGYVVLSVNYRSGIGYGMEFREALGYGTRGASEVADVTGAALYLRTRPDVDPKRIGAWGGSYGGYLVAFALAKSSELYAAGVDIHGVHDWSSEIKVWAPSWDPAKNEELGRLAWQSSPLAYVDTWRSPVLLIHGDDDRNVAFTETIHLAEELRKRNVDVELMVLPDEVHDFLLHRSWIAVYTAAAEFFDRVMARP